MIALLTMRKYGLNVEGTIQIFGVFKPREFRKPFALTWRWVFGPEGAIFCPVSSSRLDAFTAKCPIFSFLRLLARFNDVNVVALESWRSKLDECKWNISFYKRWRKKKIGSFWSTRMTGTNWSLAAGNLTVEMQSMDAQENMWMLSWLSINSRNSAGRSSTMQLNII